MIEIEERRIGDVVILDLKGRKRMDPGTETLDKVLELLERGDRKILLNYQSVDYMDSSGVGEIVSCYIKASTKKAKLRLLNPSSHLIEILQHCQLDTILPCFFREREAIASSWER